MYKELLVMENIDRRRPHSIALSDKELSYAENIMYIYHLRSISDVFRYLLIREHGWITEEQTKAEVK